MVLTLGVWPAAVSAAEPATSLFLISQHGAVGDGKTLNVSATQSVIDACAKSGGDTVVVPEGVFLTGSIFLKPGVNLCIEKNGVLKGSQNTNDYPWIDTRIAGLEMKWPAALVNADGVSQLQITGAGTIDGSGDNTWLPAEFRTAVPPEKGTPVFRDIIARNITAKNCGSAGRIVGLPKSPIINLQLNNVTIQSTGSGLVVKNTSRLKCENVTINGKLYAAPLAMREDTLR
jgi:polygalacturonase